MGLKYVVIDMTTVEAAKILHVAEMQASVYWGRILTDRGLKVIAPALDARAFTKMEHLQLQYLFWNTFQETPSDDYATLVQACLAKAQALQLDQTPLRELERDAKRATERRQANYTSEDSFTDPNQLPLAPGIIGTMEAPSSRPRSAGATKQVWDIADRIFGANGGQIPDRKTFIAECELAGINGSTASTQFSKWKASKNVRTN